MERRGVKRLINSGKRTEKNRHFDSMLRGKAAHWTDVNSKKD